MYLGVLVTILYSSELQFNLSLGIIGVVYLAPTIAYGVGTVIIGPITDRLVRCSNFLVHIHTLLLSQLVLQLLILSS